MFGPITAFALDDVDPTRPKYELTRFSAPFVLLALSVGALWLAPAASSVILAFTVLIFILMAGSILHLSNFGLSRLSWIPFTAFALSILFGLLSLALEPADAWGGLSGLIFLLGVVWGYFYAGIKLIVLTLKQTRTK